MSGPYVRVYYSINDDPRFDTIRANNARFATWVRLLMAADAVWPASALLPRGVQTKPLIALVDAGIVELLSDHRFRIHGLDAERERRKASASVGGRANAERLLTERTSVDVPRRAEQSKSKDEHRVRMFDRPTKLQALCPTNPEHSTLFADGKTWCMPCNQAIA